MALTPTVKKLMDEWIEEISSEPMVTKAEDRGRYFVKKNEDAFWKAWNSAHNFSKSDFESIFKQVDPYIQIKDESSLYRLYGFFDTSTKMLYDRKISQVVHTRTVLMFPKMFSLDKDVFIDWMMHDLMYDVASYVTHREKNGLSDAVSGMIYTIFEKKPLQFKLGFLKKNFFAVTDYSNTILISALKNGKYVRIHGSSLQGKTESINKFKKELNPDVEEKIHWSVDTIR